MNGRRREVKSKKVDWGREWESMIFSAHNTDTKSPKGVAKIHYIIVVWCIAPLTLVHTPFLMGVKMDFSMRDGKYESKTKTCSYKIFFGVAILSDACVCVILDYNLSFYGFGEIIMSKLRSQRERRRQWESTVGSNISRQSL